MKVTQRELSGQGSGEGDAFGTPGGPVDVGEPRIVGRHGNGSALGMDGGGRVATGAVDDGIAEASVDRRESDVVIEELGELHHHQRVARVRSTHVVVDVGRYHSSAGQ